MPPRNSGQDWPEQYADAVRGAAPEVPLLSAADQDALWRRVEEGAALPAPRRTRWKAVVAALVALGAVGVAGGATAGVFSAHTGKGPSDAEDVELGGPGERLDPAAPDFAAVVAEETADIRFPSVRARDVAVEWEVANYARDSEPALVSTGVVRLWTAGHALCAWSDAWAVALRTGDTAAQERAAAVVLGARTWTSITDTDPDLAADSEFDWLPDLERAIRSEDPTAARRALFGHQACMPGLAPELGLGKRW